MIARARSLTFIASAAALLAAAVPAAAIPTVAYPSRASVAASRPSFLVAQEPGGRVNTITVAHTRRLDSLGILGDWDEDGLGAQLLDVPEEGGLVTTPDRFYAGTFFFQYTWRPVAPDGTTGDLQISGIRDFSIPAKTRSVKVTRIYQERSGPAAGFMGTFVTNAVRAKFTCVVRNGRKVLIRMSRTTFVDAPLRPQGWECLDRRIPERLDGKRLKLTVTVVAGRVKATGTRTFVAR